MNYRPGYSVEDQTARSVIDLVKQKPLRGDPKRFLCVCVYDIDTALSTENKNAAQIN